MKKKNYIILCLLLCASFVLPSCGISETGHQYETEAFELVMWPEGERSGFDVKKLFDVEKQDSQVYYFSRPDSEAVLPCELHVRDLESEEDTLLWKQDGGCLEGSLRVDQTGVYWISETKPYQFWRYDFEDKTADVIDLAGDESELEAMVYDVWDGKIYRFAEGSLEYWDQGWNVMFETAAVPQGKIIDGGWFGIWDSEENAIVRVNVATGDASEPIRFAETEDITFVQANEFYAIWVNGNNQICVHDYETGREIIIEDTEVPDAQLILSGKYLAHKSVFDTITLFKLEERQWCHMLTGTSDLRVLDVGAEGVWIYSGKSLVLNY